VNTVIRSAIFAVAAVVSAGGASAAPIPGLFSTGVDGTGALLPGGSIDPHYSVVSPAQPAAVLSDGNVWGSWPTSTTGKWINYADSTSTYGTYTFYTSFSLNGLDPASAQISGVWTSDNGSTMYLNGTPVAGLGSTDFTSLHAFSINSGFVAGTNTLSFAVVMDSWDGLLVSQISGTADPIPEPSSVLLTGVALGALFSRVRPRRRHSPSPWSKRLAGARRELVGAFVHGVSGMASHPAPLDLVPRRGGEQALP
jgi:hypothetical protein